MTRAALAPLLSVSIAVACQTAPASPGRPADGSQADRDEQAGGEGDKGDKDEREPASPLGAMGGLGKLGPLGAMFASKLDEPGPYDAPRRSKGFKKGAPHWLALSLEGEVTELQAMELSVMGGAGKAIELQPFAARLREAAADPNVRGLLLRVKDLAVDWSAADELRAALVAFKGDGQRTLACHADNAVGEVYHVLTACDRLGLSPHGMVTIAGAAATPIHLKGLLDRLGVVPDFVHVGAFKGAAEPLTRTAPSKEMIETLEAIVARYHATLHRGLVDGRRLDDAKASAAIDAALYGAEGARAAGLVDDIGVWESFREQVLDGGEWTTLKMREGAGSFDLGKLQVFLGLAPPKRPSEKHVALVYALGNVIDGDGEGILGARQEIAGHTLSTALRAMADDDAIAAIVLRVNSGGGSAIASEQIFQAVAAAKAKKPVIVSMGRVAASGGYYISTGATKIYATPETLTGSIGVVGGKVALGGALKRLGVDAHHVGKGKRSAIWSPMTPWSADERADVLRMMEETYKVFVDRVAQSRSKGYDEIHAIAQGRVWTGADARERGLVDALGSLEDALADARQLAGVAPTVELEIYPPEPTLKDLLQSLGPVSLPVGLRAALLEIEAQAGPRTARAIEGAMRSLLLVREQPIQAITWTPLLIGS